ncbi:MAG: molecular chaperone [Ignavibacteria bacterium]
MLVHVRRFPTFRPLWREIADFEREIDRMFNTFFSTEGVTDEGYAPAINVVEKDNEYVVLAEMPGVRKEDLKLSLENDVLTISGTRKDNALPEKAHWLRNEIQRGEFTRSITLPKGVKVEEISAELKNGILHVVLPKAEEMRSREITIH